MTTLRYPALFQVNTRVRLSALAAELGRETTLDDIPDYTYDKRLYNRSRDDRTWPGLYLDMPAWGYHVFAVSPAGQPGGLLR